MNQKLPTLDLRHIAKEHLQLTDLLSLQLIFHFNSCEPCSYQLLLLPATTASVLKQGQMCNVV